MDAQRSQGVSPRERGNQYIDAVTQARKGCIPARAGEPFAEERSGPRPGVYPRASGGTLHLYPDRRVAQGVSPRERGNRAVPPARLPRRGCIPARAGEPALLDRRFGVSRVYPRASGGTFSASTLPIPRRGVSPRERGNREAAAAHLPDLGCIPARAGEPRLCRGAYARNRVYPRASGGTRLLDVVFDHLGGVSPRERGNLGEVGGPTIDIGCIPARAGEPAELCRRMIRNKVYPRASGGTEQGRRGSPSERGVSPRERGNLRAAFYCLALQGCIPARAGEPQTSRR